LNPQGVAKIAVLTLIKGPHQPDAWLDRNDCPLPTYPSNALSHSSLPPHLFFPVYVIAYIRELFILPMIIGHGLLCQGRRSQRPPCLPGEP
jgi:hypothetical protein